MLMIAESIDEAITVVMKVVPKKEITRYSFERLVISLLLLEFYQNRNL